MTKTVVIMLKKYLAAHYANFIIQVNSIYPIGLLKQQSQYFLSNYSFRAPFGRLVNESEVMPNLDFLISNENSYTIRQNISIEGGFTAW